MSYLAKLLGGAYKEGMTEEEIAQALEAAKVGVAPEPNDDLGKELLRLKNALSKSTSENADWKRQLREKQTEEERKAQEAAELLTTLQQERDELRRDKTISDNRAQLIGLGYEDALALETAQAMMEGNTSVVFANQKKHIEAQAAAMRASILKDTPAPPAGAGSRGVDYQKKIDEARAAGSLADVAYLTRLQAQEAAQATT